MALSEIMIPATSTRSIEDALDDGGEDMPFIVESIAMESFPGRLKVPRAGVELRLRSGNPAVPDPVVKISWSDTGGHTLDRSDGTASSVRTGATTNKCGSMALDTTGVQGTAFSAPRR